mmetsp:Transcript_2044/g.4432  ORF Transcript_2044/g.4432 Transcript_2044/m.4432 type:complete len:489 (+) Transcript_2044:112-1578(+)|eukprot:CAMPEP_0172298066 /NCGR_PEP_ID=MMETSP1058-20130122/874_1 /TAXON_ID=83371 /ORGANISM="Detonula confervacea, Strain CCMP 353" /LENGTH=488 /DNA_ID=CAMNT_0013007301 /DNA_START=77 /DNA_END=1543 /DNA_ORIENTATION=-
MSEEENSAPGETPEEPVPPQEESPAPNRSNGDDGTPPQPDEPTASEESSNPPQENAISSPSQQPPPAADDEEPPKPQRRAVVAPLPLEWTRMNERDPNDANPASIVRYPWDVIEIDPNETDLTVVGTAGQKITRMGSDLKTRVSPNLTHLVLRSHLIRTMEGIAGMEQLELLELYDNMVDELRELDGGTADGDGEGKNGGGLPGRNLRVLDMSYNVIRDMGPVSFCPNLQELYIAQNKIKSIKGLKQLKLLRKVDLGANRIRVIDGDELSGLDNLEELWLGKNKIEKIEGLSKLTKLRRLDVQSNRLTKIENLEAQVDTLEELYLSHNGIDVEGATCETGLALPFTQLNTIDMCRNRLTDTSPFGHLTSLTDLWISGNDIKTYDDIDHLRGLTQLDVVYLEYNPVASEFEYRKKLAELVPSLTQIDANLIKGHGYSMSMGGGNGGNLVERMRQMQEAAIQKAKIEEQKLVAAEKQAETAVREEQETKE